MNKAWPMHRDPSGGAALDVLAKESPPPAHPLLGLDNIVFTPYATGVIFNSVSRPGEFIFAKLSV